MLARNIPHKAVASEKSSKAWKYFVKIDDSSRIIGTRKSRWEISKLKQKNLKNF